MARESIRRKIMERPLRAVLCMAAFLLITGASYAPVSAQWAHYANRNQVRAIELDSQGGALWYATDGGLVRLDLEKGISQVFARGENLPSCELTALLAQADGSVLAGTWDKGLILRLRSGRWVSAGIYDGLPHERVYCLARASAGGESGPAPVWVGTERGARKFLVNSSDLEPQRGSNVVLEDLTVYDILETAQGVAYLATSSGLWRMDVQGGLTRFATLDGIRALAVSQVEVSADGQVYLVSGGALQRFDGQMAADLVAPFGSSPVLHLRGTDLPEGWNLAAATESGLWFIDTEGQWSSRQSYVEKPSVVGPTIPGTGGPVLGTDGDGIFWPRSPRSSGDTLAYENLKLPGPLYNLLTVVAVDSSGTVWASSASDATPREKVGVSRFDGHTWNYFTESNSPLLINLISSIGVAPDGRKFFGTWFGGSGIASGGFNILDDRGTADPADDLWETYTALQSPLTMDVIRGNFAFDSGGGVWIASQENSGFPGGLDFFDPQAREFVSYSDQLADRNVHTVAVDGFDNVWIGYLSRGLAVIPGGRFGTGLVREVTGFREILGGEAGIVDLEVDPANQLWIATTTKVVRLNFQENAADQSGFSYKEFKPPSYAGLAANSIAMQGIDVVWFGTDSGIYRLSLPDSGWTVFNRGNSSLADDQVYDLALDQGRGVLWAATSAGLSGLWLAAPEASGRESSTLVVRPNPWYPSREPVLMVTGVPRYSKVVVYTSSGEPVRRFEARESSGKMLFWDGTNQHGRNCASGVYLIQATSPDGQRVEGKVAIIR